MKVLVLVLLMLGISIAQVNEGDGLKVEHYKNGQIKSITPYLEGKIHGFAHLYSATGELLDKRLYDNGYQIPDRASLLSISKDHSAQTKIMGAGLAVSILGIIIPLIVANNY